MDDSLLQLRTALAGRYAVDREIGSGGMAVVFLADDLKHHRKVAVKVLRPDLAAALGGKRFLREIEIAAQLTHSHILPLHDSGEAGGFLYYVMPYVEGESLRARLEREGALPIGDTLRILRDVADALTCAHRHGVLHRDIKPDNVMLADRHALVTDFGVAKAVSEAGGKVQLTTAGVSLGTPAYMAPEQAAAEPELDHRADLYSFGVLAYETLVGRLPFARASAQAMMLAHLSAPPQSVAELRDGVPPALAALVMRCLEKSPDKRYQSANELLAALESLITPSGGVTPFETAAARVLAVTRRPGRAAAIGGVLLLAIAAALVMGLRHRARVRWARERAIPQIRQLADSGRWEPAYQLALQVARIIPEDSVLGSLWARVSTRVNIRTAPPGARVYRREYAADDSSWQYLGTTPLDNVRMPWWEDLSRMRFEKEGFRTLEVADVVTDSAYALSDGRVVPDGMVRVPGGLVRNVGLVGLEGLAPITLGTYFMDAYEVTNRQFKEFVDSGGYRRRELWDRSLLLEGRPISWEAARARFVDRTGRPGPSTWEAGDYPAGQDEYPVGGVSWYEAAAYARFTHQSLPTIYHWAHAAVTPLGAWIVPRSNLGGESPAGVGTFQGLGPYGTFDMAGNVREWCLNATGDDRYILGGGWNDPTYHFNDAFAQSPFDRSPTNGIRLVQYLPGDTTLTATSHPANRAHRDFASERPVPEGIFQVYRRLYEYDRTPLRPVIEETDSSADDWVRQRITFDAAYGNERVIAYLFLPRHHPPPYQTIVYFPGAGALDLRSSRASLEVQSFDFMLKSGRAVMYPVYKSTYERGDSLRGNRALADESNFYREHVIMWAKDMRRSVDYLETRPDIDTRRLAYYGYSWGGFLGGLMTAVEPRFKTVVLAIAGLQWQRGQPEVEPLNFLPRVRIPVLMLNGRYDYFFPEASQLAFYRLLGTAPQHKRQVISEGGHSVPRTQLISETLAWLDRYLGPVR